jgi:RNA polymerase sigma-70 factor, ECF subfamily
VDADGFAALVGPFRRELVAYCYRMSGSLADAEDLVQECLIRAWKGIGGFAGRASLRSWLYRIATNVCLTELERRPRRVTPLDVGHAGDPAGPLSEPSPEPWIDPAPESLWAELASAPEARVSSRESVAIAFLATIQTLPPLQRAVLLLRDVLGWSAAETAETLESSVAAVNSALQRARETIERRGARRERPAAIDAGARALLERYVRAWEAGDVDALTALLREDATLAMPPMAAWFAGRDAIARFLARFMGMPIKLVPIAAAGGLGAAAYVRAPDTAQLTANAIHVLDVAADGSIAALDVFLDPRLFAAFGLAPVLAE